MAGLLAMLCRLPDQPLQRQALLSQLIAQLGDEGGLLFQGRGEGQRYIAQGFSLWARPQQVIWHG